MHQVLKISFILSLSHKIVPWLSVLTVILSVVGLGWGLHYAPSDMYQGDAMRIMYVHVPAAWMALGIYTLIASCSFIFLVWQAPLAGLIAQEATPIGTSFTAITLVTGSLWGKPMWGTWWAWDARLTSVLLLFFLYLGMLCLQKSITDSFRRLRVNAMVAMVGVINIPIIKWSVDWWHTLHQPASIMKWGKSSIDASMMGPLFLMAAAFAAYTISVLMIRLQTALCWRRIDRLRAL